jgi:hypothetical protein
MTGRRGGCSRFRCHELAIDPEHFHYHCWQHSSEKARLAASGPVNPMLNCPYCGTTGQVHARTLRMKAGVSGGKATGAVLTGGLSLLATGLSRTQDRTQMRCFACGTGWLV